MWNGEKARAIAQKYPCELASLPQLDMIEHAAFMHGDDATRRWVRRRMKAIEYLCREEPLT